MHAPQKTSSAETWPFVEQVEVRGHIIDSLILPKILDAIAANGGNCRIKHITIGKLRDDPSHAVLEVRANKRRRSAKTAGSDRRPRGRADRRSAIAASSRPISTALSRRLLQHDQPADRGPRRRALDRGRRPGNGLCRTRRSEKDDCPMPRHVRNSPRRSDRCRPRRRASLSRGTCPRGRDLRVHGQQRLHGETQERRHPPDRPATRREPRGGRTHRRRCRPRCRTHRQRRVPGADHSHGLHRCPAGRQRTGDARHRAGHVWHESWRLSRPRASRPRPGTHTTSARSTAFAGWGESGRRSRRGSFVRG